MYTHKTITNKADKIKHNNLLVFVSSYCLLVSKNEFESCTLSVSKKKNVYERAYRLCILFTLFLALSFSFFLSLGTQIPFFRSFYIQIYICIRTYINFLCSVYIFESLFSLLAKGMIEKKDECISPCFTRHLLSSIRLNHTHGIRV